MLKPFLDFSYPVEPHYPSSPVVVSGKVIDLLNNATPTGKILNGLDFPMFKGDLPDEAYATDVVAWGATRGLHHLDPSASFPIEDNLWGLGGHKFAFTFVHVDAEGFSTQNLVQCGGKGWGVLEDLGLLKLSSIDFFLDPGFHLQKVSSKSQYEIEVIFLRPGDML